MNTPGQEMIATNAGAVGNIMINSVIEEAKGFSVYQIIGIIVIFTIFASIVSYSRNLFTLSFEQIKSWFVKHVPLLNKHTEPVGVDDNHMGATNLIYPNADGGGSVPAAEPSATNNSVSAPEAPAAASSDQSWCLVGEDMTGRWCVQVPAMKACDADRVYASRNHCEKPPSNG